MIGIKHFMDVPQGCDGKRIWVETQRLTRDLREWCRVDYVLTELGPTGDLAQWLARHPARYRTFRDQYRRQLLISGRFGALGRLARMASRENVTLLHQSGDPEKNTAAALRDIVNDLFASRSDGWRMGLARSSPCPSAKATRPASVRTPQARARVPSASCEVASTIYRWQIITDEPRVSRPRQPDRISLREFLIGCVRQVNRCARLIRLACRQHPES